MKRSKTGELLCATCFFDAFEGEVHNCIITHHLFSPGDVVACGASGGKDSTVLMHLLCTLNDRHHYGIRIVLVSIDEGIAGYRDESLKAVRRNAATYQLSLTIVSFKELFGWSMDEIVKEHGPKSSCTFCGVFRRQGLDRAVTIVGATKIATGHNADDIAETVLMNLLRSDTPRLARCAGVATEGEGVVPRVKPLKFAYEKEIVLYAHFKKLDYFTTECSYSTEAFRGNARTLLKNLEMLRPSAIADVVHSGDCLPQPELGEEGATSTLQRCSKCGYISSQSVCRACVLMEGLNSGRPRVEILGSAAPHPAAPQVATPHT